MSDKASSEPGEEGEPVEQGSTKASSPGSSSSMPLPSMLLERKMETLITEWNKSPDMLFTIHPTDGSFLVWHVKYLDEFNQGIFRQVQVSRKSRTWKTKLLIFSTSKRETFSPHISISYTLNLIIHHLLTHSHIAYLSTDLTSWSTLLWYATSLSWIGQLLLPQKQIFIKIR